MAARKRTPPVDPLTRALGSVPDVYPDLCTECARTFPRPLGSDSTVCLRCAGDIVDDRERLQYDLTELQKECDQYYAQGEELETEKDQLTHSLRDERDKVTVLERVLRDMAPLVKQVRARLALANDAPWDHPDRHLLGALDEAEAAIAEALG